MSNPLAAPLDPINAPMLFGALLLLGLLADRLCAFARFVPRITVYLVIGVVVGPAGCAVLDAPALSTASVFADIAIALLLFELGRYVDFAWMMHERWLLATSALETALTFAAVAIALLAIGLDRAVAIPGALIAIATAPTVVMSVVRDLGADGNVTKRLLAMTALNNIVALVGLYGLLPILQVRRGGPIEPPPHWRLPGLEGLDASAMMFVGALLAAWVAARTVLLVARVLRKDRNTHFALITAALVFVVGLARRAELSVIVAVLAFAVLSKNLDRRRVLLEPEFDAVRRIFSILLFVVIGASLSLGDVAQYAGAIAALAVARLGAKVLASAMLARPARLPAHKAVLLGLALSPMAEVAVSISTLYASAVPDVAPALVPIVAGAVVVFESIGPFLTQFALRRAGETPLDPQLGRPA